MLSAWFAQLSLCFPRDIFQNFLLKRIIISMAWDFFENVESKLGEPKFKFLESCSPGPSCKIVSANSQVSYFWNSICKLFCKMEKKNRWMSLFMIFCCRYSVLTIWGFYLSNWLRFSKLNVTYWQYSQFRKLKKIMVFTLASCVLHTRHLALLLGPFYLNRVETKSMIYACFQKLVFESRLIRVLFGFRLTPFLD